MDTITQKPSHFWRIHARVTRRVWSDLPMYVRDIIAADTAHETSEFQWFDKKVTEDATRLFEDSSYYDSSVESFRTPKSDPWVRR
jgi:hypothetical protein